MDLRDMPTTNRNYIRICKCGCDTFRFKYPIEDIEKTRHWWDTECRNCQHLMKEHVINAR